MAASDGLDLRVERTTHRPGDEMVLLVDAPSDRAAEVTVTHLGELVRVVHADLSRGRTPVALGTFGVGSYAVRLTAPDGHATTAFDVLVDPTSRLRYGFVSDFGPGRTDTALLADSLRAFHITAVQLYDWMYRHAELVPPTAQFEDALGRRLSLGTVAAVRDAVHDVGARAIAYAAVYGAGEQYASAHPDLVLHHRDGRPWMLADFLWIMDIRRGSDWTRHIVGEMARAVEEMGFDGLHLDQYGDPKLALGAAGDVVDLAEAFPAFITEVREALPDSTLIFNNVNDFPTRTTVLAPQDATYIEVWPPHDEYADLVRLVDVARDVAPTRPAVLAAYLAPFASRQGPEELAAATLALATVWAAGGQYLLFGEVEAALTDPYYPNHARLERHTVGRLRRYADFSVANGDLLFDLADPGSGARWSLGVDDTVRVAGAATSTNPRAGCVWVRTSSSGRRLVVQLVDYRDQTDARWNVPRTPTTLVSGLRLTVPAVSVQPRVWFGSPSAGPELVPVPLVEDSESVVAEVPAFDTWAVLVVDR